MSDDALPELPLPADVPDDDTDLILPDKPITAPESALVGVGDVHELENSRTALGDITALAENIRVRGLLHPILVRRAADPSHGRPYELIAGYRRLAAFGHLGRDEIPAIIREATDEDVLSELVSENLERETPSAIDEARTMQRMIDLFGLSHREVAARLGMSKSQVTKRLGLLKLPEKVQTMVGEGQISASHAEVIARLERPESQEELADLAVKSEAPVSKLNGYATKIKERDDERVDDEERDDATTPAEQPLDALTVADMTPMTRLVPKDDLSAQDILRATVYALLRCGHDEEMLDVLAEQHGVSFAHLWEWVYVLTDEQIAEMHETLVRRWLAAAHRYPTFPESLRARYAAAETDEPVGDPDLPDAADEDDDWEDWDDEFEMDDDVF